MEEEKAKAGESVVGLADEPKTTGGKSTEEKIAAGCRFPQWLQGVMVIALIVALFAAALAGYSVYLQYQVHIPTAKEVAVAAVVEARGLVSSQAVQDKVRDEIRAVARGAVNTDEVAQKVADKVIAKLPAPQVVTPGPTVPAPTQPGPVQPGPSITQPTQPGPVQPTQPAPAAPAPISRRARIQALLEKNR